jgi:LacI family transcriptional regulator
MNLKEFARHLGLSQTTVSRALDNYPEVNEQTRARVREAAERLGYRPNRAARRMATGRSGMLGLVIQVERDVLIDPVLAELLGGIGEAARRADLDIVISPCTSDKEMAAYDRLIGSGAVDGLIVCGTRTRDERILHLANRAIPFVVHGRSEVPKAYAFMDIDNQGAFRQATSFLADLGHRRIALINGDLHYAFAAARVQGYREALRERGLPVDPTLEHEGVMTSENGYRAIKKLFATTKPPSALLCSSMLMAHGALRALAEMYLVPGRDVSVIAHDDDLPALQPEYMVPPLTTTRSRIRAGGERAAELLIARLSGKPVEELQEVWPVELIVRGSTAPLRCTPGRG